MESLELIAYQLFSQRPVSVLGDKLDKALVSVSD